MVRQKQSLSIIARRIRRGKLKTAFLTERARLRSDTGALDALTKKKAKL
jgi:ATP-dependent helicase YprA (DUF1998 family)